LEIGPCHTQLNIYTCITMVLRKNKDSILVYKPRFSNFLGKNKGHETAKLWFSLFFKEPELTVLWFWIIFENRSDILNSNNLRQHSTRPQTTRLLDLMVSPMWHVSY
jgi:hypothetical protein